MHHSERRVLFVYVRMFIICYPVSKSYTFDSLLLPPNNLFTRFMKLLFDYSITWFSSMSLLRDKCIFSRFFDLFCNVNDFT